MKVIFYVAGTCGNIDFHFIVNLEHGLVITVKLANIPPLLYLLTGISVLGKIGHFILIISLYMFPGLNYILFLYVVLLFAVKCYGKVLYL